MLAIAVLRMVDRTDPSGQTIGLIAPPALSDDTAIAQWLHAVATRKGGAVKGAF